MKKRLFFATLFLLLCLPACRQSSPSPSPNEESDGRPHTEHRFGEWQITSEATCTEVGIRVRICQICRHMETETLPKKEHAFGEWTQTAPQSCTESGQKARTCTVCEFFDTQTLNPCGHSFGEWIPTREAGCESCGIETQTCQVCSAAVRKETPPSGHVWDTEWTQTLAPACESKGEQVLYCARCDKTQVREVKPSGHSYHASETKKATLTEDGYRIYTCASCQSSYRETFFATGSLGVEFAYRRDGSCFVKSVGSFSGTELFLPASHDGHAVTSIAEHAFAGCSSLTRVVLPDSLLSLEKNAFEACVSLQSVRLGDGLSVLEDSAFFGCSALKSVEGGKGLSEIGKYAFWGCGELGSVVLGKHLTAIGDLAFSGCGKLGEVYYCGTPNEWSKIAVGSDNLALLNATRYFYSETPPTDVGKYWHDSGGIPEKWEQKKTRQGAVSFFVILHTYCRCF